MRRVMFTVVATVLMAGAVPAAALAHHGHHKHHARHHAKIRRFGDQTQPTSMSPSDNAGTVTDFSNGVLTIQLNDGSTVKGAVTNDTEIECTSTQPQTTTHSEGDGSGDQSSGSGDQSSGSGDQSSGGDNQSSGTEDQGDNDANETQGEDQNQTQGEDQGEDQNQSSSCSSSSLKDGAVVHEASLRLGGSGASWQKVELVS